MRRRLKPGLVVTVPAREPLEEWSGQPGVVIEVKRKGPLKGKIIVLVASAVDDLRASRFVFEREELTKGGEVSEYVQKLADHYLRIVEEWEEGQAVIKAGEKVVDELTEQMARKGVKLETVSKTSDVWLDFGTYPCTVYYNAYIWQGEEIARVVKGAGRFFYADHLMRVYKERFGTVSDDLEEALARFDGSADFLKQKRKIKPHQFVKIL
ncbi:hypothetical protein [Paludifilum halophilum]|uniref:Uncharacterized protein n=1 Tax=Paludifilum halophilum TaxID=1642702 RepID=A0A235BAB0_9BACL|nr:hypothetical protein [Paludifilum halophilum]OYD08525.1 hypothetical protein CHM34_06780 [Paludifilum halophilum]